MKNIILNAGYYNTKFKDNKGIYSTHQTRIQENSFGLERCIVYEGETYDIGEGGRDIQRRDNNFVHLMCTFYHILNMAKDKEHVRLIVALPMNQYLNSNFRNSYVEEIKKHKPLKGEVNGQYKQVYVDDVICYMEGASAVLVNQQQFANNICGLIDIGGNTVNAAVFNNMNLISSTITTLDLGTIKVEKDIVDKLNIVHGWNVQDYEVPHLMKSKDPFCIQPIETICLRFIKEIKTKLLEKKWSLGSLPLFFTGGGSLFFKEYIPKQFENYTISNDCIFDNLKGLEVVAKQIDDSYNEE